MARNDIQRLGSACRMVRKGINLLGLDETLLNILNTSSSGGSLRGGSFGPEKVDQGG